MPIVTSEVVVGEVGEDEVGDVLGEDEDGEEIVYTTSNPW